MRPHTPCRTLSETASSLDDSSYDIVSVSDVSEGGLLSDDEAGRTESLASVDGRETPDRIDIYSTDSDESEEEQEYPHSSVPGAALDIRSQCSALVDVYPSVDGSGYSARTAQPDPSVSQNFPHLIFDKDYQEPNVLGGDKLIHVFQSTEEENMMSELSVYGSPYVGLSMHLTTSRVVPRRRESFRLLVTAYNEHLVHDAALHIDQALHRVGIIKSDVKFVVERCRVAYYGKDRRTIQLDIEGCHGLQTAPGGLVGRCGKHPTPDLALFLHPSLAHVPAGDVEQMEETFALTRDAMLRCKVPMVDLSEYHPLFQAQPMTYLCHQDSMFLQVEIGRKNEKAVIEQLPVDLDKFLAIDPKTLGRHLAFILPKLDDRDGAVAVWHRAVSQKARNIARTSHARTLGYVKLGRNRFSEWVQPAAQKARAMTSNLKFKWAPISWLLVTVGIVLLAKGIAYPSKVELPDSLQHLSANLTSAAAVMPVVIPSLFSVSSTSTQALSTSVDDRMKTVNLIEDRIKFWAQSALAPKLSAMYQISTREDNIIILTPSSEFPTTSKSELQLSVTRDAQLLKSHINRLPSGSYVVELEPEQAHGVVNIMINCRIKKVRHYQGLVIDLGSPWLKAAIWNRAADAVAHVVHEDLAAAQHNAQAISIRMTTSLQKYVKDLSNLGQKTAHVVEDTGKSLLHISADTALAPWKALWQLQQSPEFKEAGNRIAHRGNEAVQLVKTAQIHAQDLWEDVYVCGMLPKQITFLPIKALARSQRNAKDLVSKLKGKKIAGKKKKCASDVKRAKVLKDSAIGAMFGQASGKPAVKCRRK